MDPITAMIGCGLLCGSFTLLAVTGVLLRANTLIERAGAQVQQRIKEFEDAAGRHQVANPSAQYAPDKIWRDTKSVTEVM